MPEVWEKHPEVYHYTSADGLRGILHSQTLFATHYKYLNDRSEMRLLHNSLPELFEPAIKEFVLERFRNNSEDKKSIRKLGGVPKVAKNLAKKFSTIHFDAIFSSTDREPVSATAFITSFCGYSSDDPYERENGLLSQWRAYGCGGFSIVFDTERLWKFCLKEREIYAYAFIMFDEVIYQSDDNAFRQELYPAIKAMQSDIVGYLRGEDIRTSRNESHVSKIVPAFARLKHRGFKEEREVRIVACPLTPERHKRMAKEFEEVRNVPVKPLRQLAAGEAAKPQIELFDFEGARKLPIKRVIVGPQKDQHSVVEMAKSLLKGTGIKVTASETPLVQWPQCS